MIVCLHNTILSKEIEMLKIMNKTKPKSFRYFHSSSTMHCIRGGHSLEYYSNKTKFVSTRVIANLLELMTLSVERKTYFLQRSFTLIFTFYVIGLNFSFHPSNSQTKASSYTFKTCVQMCIICIVWFVLFLLIKNFN